MMDLKNSEYPAHPVPADIGNMESWRHGLTKGEYAVIVFVAAGWDLQRAQQMATRILDNEIYP